MLKRSSTDRSIPFRSILPTYDIHTYVHTYKHNSYTPFFHFSLATWPALHCLRGSKKVHESYDLQSNLEIESTYKPWPAEQLRKIESTYKPWPGEQLRNRKYMQAMTCRAAWK